MWCSQKAHVGSKSMNSLNLRCLVVPVQVEKADGYVLSGLSFQGKYNREGREVQRVEGVYDNV